MREAHNPDTPVWPENAQAVAAFLAISGQWRVYPVSTNQGVFKQVFAGLDYSAAAAGLRLAGIDLEPADWQRVRIMEDEARKCLNESGP